MTVRGLLPRALALAVALGSVGAAAERVHVVKPGETLWQIAEALAGDPHRWPQIYRANRDQIKDPSRLYPGQRLAIPDFEAEAASTAAPRPAPIDEE